jgi:hypothetical protein
MIVMNATTSVMPQRSPYIVRTGFPRGTVVETLRAPLRNPAVACHGTRYTIVAARECGDAAGVRLRYCVRPEGEARWRKHYSSHIR